MILPEDKFEILEDAYWGLKAKEASEEGYLGVDEGEKLFNKMRERNLKSDAKGKSRRPTK